MIKIIKDGKKPEPVIQKYTVTCNLCGCVFECESSDFEAIDKSLYGNRYIKCPTCGQLITVPNLCNHKLLDDILMAESRCMRNEIFKAYESSENKTAKQEIIEDIKNYVQMGCDAMDCENCKYSEITSANECIATYIAENLYLAGYRKEIEK